MHLLLEQGIRGGITVCVKKHSVANNHYIPDTFDPNKPSKFLTYLDANNLYGWAMSKYMPYGDFQWLNRNNLDILQYILKVDDDSPIGYILEVDIEYPQHLHDYHSDFPFLPVNEYVQGTKNRKLLTTLKKKYVCHYSNLKQAVSFGLQITKVYRILQFLQSPWLKKYIDLNTIKRQQANNNFEEDFFKLLNNAVFGKCMENIRKGLKLQLVCNEKKLLKLIAEPTFKDRIIYDESLCAVLSDHKSVYFNNLST